MTEHQLSILLSLRDEASKQIEQFSQKVQNEMKNAGDAFRDFGHQAAQVGRDMTMIGAAITAPLALAFKTTADNSLEAYESMKRLGDAGRELQVAIGTSLTPVVEKISYRFAEFTQWFETLNPQIRDTVLQAALVTGLFLTFDGVLLRVIGRISDLVGRMLQFAAIHPVLLLIAVALTLIIANWEKIREVAIPVMNALEIGASMVAIGFQTMVKYMSDALAEVSDGLRNVLTYLSMIPGPQQKVFQSMRDGAQATTEFFNTVSEAADITISDLQNNIETILQTGNGNIASIVDVGINKIQELYNFINNPPKADINASGINSESIVVSEQRKIDQLRNIWTAWNSEKTQMTMSQLQSETEFYNVAIAAQTKAHESMWTTIGQAKDQFATGISKLFVDMMKGTADVKKFFIDLGWQMIEILVNFAVQKAVNWALAQ